MNNLQKFFKELNDDHHDIIFEKKRIEQSACNLFPSRLFPGKKKGR